MGEIVDWLSDNLAADAIVCNGAGNFSAWVHRFFRYKGFATQLAPTSGSMGYGVPAAVAAKRLYPDKTVVGVTGDGDFMMTSQELATAVHHGINVVIVIVNNSMYGTIRMHQERDYPARTIATQLTNPDFVAFAEAYGAFGVRVETTAAFPAAFAAALAAAKPALIEVRVDPEAITPTTTLSALRGAGKGRK